jgi:hypothetical protein
VSTLSFTCPVLAKFGLRHDQHEHARVPAYCLTNTSFRADVTGTTFTQSANSNTKYSRAAPLAGMTQVSWRTFNLVWSEIFVEN